MAQYADRGVLPVSREKLWTLLDLRTKDDVIPLIHPDVVSQGTFRETGGAVVVARGINFRGKIRPNTRKPTSSPPDRLRRELLEAPEGPMVAGSWGNNRYCDALNGTLVVTQGNITVRGYPHFLQKRLARTVLNRIGAQDHA